MNCRPLRTERRIRHNPHSQPQKRRTLTISLNCLQRDSALFQKASKSILGTVDYASSILRDIVSACELQINRLQFRKYFPDILGISLKTLQCCFQEVVEQEKGTAGLGDQEPTVLLEDYSGVRIEKRKIKEKEKLKQKIVRHSRISLGQISSNSQQAAQSQCLRPKLYRHNNSTTALVKLKTQKQTEPQEDQEQNELRQYLEGKQRQVQRRHHHHPQRSFVKRIGRIGQGYKFAFGYEGQKVLFSKRSKSKKINPLSLIQMRTNTREHTPGKLENRFQKEEQLIQLSRNPLQLLTERQKTFQKSIGKAVGEALKKRVITALQNDFEQREIARNCFFSGSTTTRRSRISNAQRVSVRK